MQAEFEALSDVHSKDKTCAGESESKHAVHTAYECAKLCQAATKCLYFSFWGDCYAGRCKLFSRSQCQTLKRSSNNCVQTWVLKGFPALPSSIWQVVESLRPLGMLDDQIMDLVIENGLDGKSALRIDFETDLGLPSPVARRARTRLEASALTRGALPWVGAHSQKTAAQVAETLNSLGVPTELVVENAIDGKSIARLDPEKDLHLSHAVAQLVRGKILHSGPSWAIIEANASRGLAVIQDRPSLPLPTAQDVTTIITSSPTNLAPDTSFFELTIRSLWLAGLQH